MADFDRHADVALSIVAPELAPVADLLSARHLKDPVVRCLTCDEDRPHELVCRCCGTARDYGPEVAQ